jgi:hypothetical protein
MDTLRIVHADRLDGEAIVVSYSDGRTVRITLEQLMSLDAELIGQDEFENDRQKKGNERV